MAKTVGICGHFNGDFEPIGGQTIKTRIITEELKNIYGYQEVKCVDTTNWKKRVPIFILECIWLVLTTKNVIILPAQNGIKVLIPFFLLLSKLFNKKLHYIVVGAWLAKKLKGNKRLVRCLKEVDYIYCQTSTLIRNLEQLGIKNNTYLMPNFKDIKQVDLNKNVIENNNQIKLCVLSRISYQKGIESAINVVDKLNSLSINKKIVLDIYGPIDNNYEGKFNELLKKYRDCISYKGIVHYNSTAETIKPYFLLLFPTKYYTEGFPATILDAYLSGVPVLASRWESCFDIIKENETGLTFNFDDDLDFFEKLKYMVSNPEKINQMKKNCLAEAKKYSPLNSMEKLIENIK